MTSVADRSITNTTESGWSAVVEQTRSEGPAEHQCRLCGATELHSVLDLGATPPCERILTAAELDGPETNYPLHLRVCTQCWLVQLPALITPEETFSEYAYYSSYSDSWVAHAERFTATATARLGLNSGSFVLEVASNDGYLLRNFVRQEIPCLGIEPSENISALARDHGIPTRTAFLDASTGAALRAEHGPADLVIANNVYAHVPDIVGFTKGLRALVASDGWVSIEVQHLLSLIECNQYDTIYHEHFQYYTVASVQRALARGGLSVVDVELLSTHGGSIRVWARPSEVSDTSPSPVMTHLLNRERAAGLFERSGYARFAQRVDALRRDLLRFLIDAAELGRSVVGYGAPGKGNTLLNYCGVRTDLLAYTVDRNPYKHGKFTPGVRIPIRPTTQLVTDRPDYVLVLPWNLRDEISDQLEYVREWGGKLVFPIPALDVLEHA